MGIFLITLYYVIWVACVKAVFYFMPSKKTAVVGVAEHEGEKREIIFFMDVLKTPQAATPFKQENPIYYTKTIISSQYTIY